MPDIIVVALKARLCTSYFLAVNKMAPSLSQFDQERDRILITAHKNQ